MSVPNDKAQTIDRQWRDGTIDRIVKIGDETFRSADIRGVGFDSAVREKDRHISSYNTAELKEIVRGFQEEYEANATGPLKSYSGWGVEREGTIDWLQRTGVISVRDYLGHPTVYVHHPAIVEYYRKDNALRELHYRQESENAHYQSQIDYSPVGKQFPLTGQTINENELWKD